MGFVSSLFGGQNDFKAKATQDQYHQDQAQLAGDPNALTPIMGQAGAAAAANPQYNFADAIQQGQQQALQQGQMNQQFQQGQQGNIADLQGMANGTSGPSTADLMLKQASDTAASRQAGAIAGVKGMNPAAQARLILQQGGAAAQQAAQAGAMQKAQEQLAARSQLTGALNAGQQGALQGIGAGTSLMGAGAGANQAQQAGNTALLGTAGQIQNQANANNIQNTLGAGQINAQVAANNQAAAMHAQDVNAGIASQNAQAAQGAGMGILSAAGGAATMGLSDERQKNIEGSGAKDIEGFLHAVRGAEYKYKDGVKDVAGEGTYVSPMAQNLEHSKLGKDMVVETPVGKAVDYAKGMGTMAAALAHVNDKLDAFHNALKSGGHIPHMAMGGQMPDFGSAPGIPVPQVGDGPNWQDQAAATAANFNKFADLAKQGKAAALTRHNQALQQNAVAAATAAGASGADESAGMNTSMTPQQVLAAHVNANPLGAMPGGATGPAMAPAAPATAMQMSTPGFGMPMQHGGMVPGHAMVHGDSPKNDTQPAMLSPGEGVIPKSIMQAPDAPERAKQFIEHLKSQKPEKGPKGYGEVLKKHRDLDERLKRIEAMCNGGKVK